MPEKRQKMTYFFPKPEKHHTILKIPGSHTLYVGPRSCTRRHDLYTRKYGKRQNVSFLFITESDVISGAYEDIICDTIGKLLEVLDPKPHIFFIGLFCIDDFLGTDEDAMIRRLSDTYPECQFTTDHIDPVALDNNKSMALKKNKVLYTFIKPGQERDKGINFIGNFVPLHPDCEFPKLLESWGYGPIRELFNCKTYEEYQDLGKSSLSLLVRFQGKLGAKYLEEECGIPRYEITTSYDPEVIAKAYGDIAEMLGVERPDFSEEIRLARLDAEATAKELNGLPLAIDSQCSYNPFSMAIALIEYGFNVKYIFRSNHTFKLEEESEIYVQEHYPDIQISRAESYSCLFNEATEEECIALGSDAARLLRAAHYADIWHDEGYFGFHGIHRLMSTLREVAKTKTDWSKVPELSIKKKKK